MIDFQNLVLSSLNKSEEDYRQFCNIPASTKEAPKGAKKEEETHEETIINGYDRMCKEGGAKRD